VTTTERILVKEI